MKYEELRDYFRLLRAKSAQGRISVEWSVIDCDRVSALPHAKSMGLQIADAVASGIQRAVEPQRGFIEDRYARMLEPVVYCRNGKHRNYGLKLWPSELSRRIEEEPSFSWLREVYPK